MFGLVSVTGTDARNFLQGQLTQDVATVTGEHSPLAAWCTPRGRVQALLRLLAEDGGIGLVLPVELLADVVTGLERYRLRASVEFRRADPDWSAQAVANQTDLELLRARGLLPPARRDASRRRDGVTAVTVDPDGRVVEIYATRPALAAAGLSFTAPLSAADWQAGRIAAGIADVVPATSARFTPHMLNLDRLGAVSFDKGCYAGQEIIARTQHLGSAKRRLAHFRAAAPLAIGDAVQLDGTSVGEVVAAADRDALALLPVELHGRELHAGRVRLEPVSVSPESR